MLIPSELKLKSLYLQRRRAGDAFQRELTSVVADLCEQVAELREQLDTKRIEYVPAYGGGVMPRSQIAENVRNASRCPCDKPQPRLLRASEITVNGWYACRVKGGKWSDILVRVDDKRLANVLWSPPICEFYGPIQLPE